MHTNEEFPSLLQSAEDERRRRRNADTLSRAASDLAKLLRESAEAAYHDSFFDAGEWSGPAHADLLEKNSDKLAQRYGFADCSALLNAIAERTSDRFVFFNFN